MLCHGSAGVAHIYWNLFLNTHVPEFLETVDFWLNVTMQMAKNNNCLTGLKTWRNKKFGGSMKLDTLLEGISGIGLVFLSYLKSDEIVWDESILLS